MAAAPRTTIPLTDQQRIVLRYYAKSASIPAIVEATGIKSNTVSDILIRLCSLNRNAALELVRYAPPTDNPAPVQAEPRKPRVVGTRAPPGPPKPKKLQDAPARAAECPNRDQHTPHPRGHVQHSDWADEMMKTH